MSTPTPSHGKVLSEVSAGAYALRVVSHDAAIHLPRHAHADGKITFVLDGAFRETFRSREVFCQSGALSFKPAGAAHTNEYGNGGARSLIIDAPAAEQRSAARTPFDRFYVSTGGVPNRLALRIARELEHFDDTAALAVEGLILELLACAVRKEQDHPRQATTWLSTAQDYLEANYRQPVSLSTLATHCGVSGVRLAIEFRRRFGLTIGAYQRRVRAEWAADELKRTSKPIVQIAVEAGFVDQSHLTRVFRHVFGQTPGAYRRDPNQR